MQKEPSTGGPFLSFDAERQASISPMKKQICARLLTVCSIQFTYGSLESIRNAKTSIKIIPSAPARKKRHAGKPLSFACIVSPFSPARSTISAANIVKKPTGIRTRICTNIGQMFLWETAAMSFYPTFTTPESRQTTAPATNSPLWNRFPAFTAERPKNTTGSKSTNAIGALKPSGMVSLVMRFLAFLLMASSVMIFLCFLFCPKEANRRGG